MDTKVPDRIHEAARENGYRVYIEPTGPQSCLLHVIDLKLTPGEPHYDTTWSYRDHEMTAGMWQVLKNALEVPDTRGRNHAERKVFEANELARQREEQWQFEDSMKIEVGARHGDGKMIFDPKTNRTTGDRADALGRYRPRANG